LLVVEVTGVVGSALFADTDAGSDAAFSLTAVCVDVGDDAALLICMASFPHSYIQAAGLRIHRRCVQSRSRKANPTTAPQSFDAASPVLSTSQKRIFSVGKAP
jgi:hypothetical protein